ncbi:MAG: Mu transposase C-terminal domain-containing protein, partial [Phycisphaeraceae bacterium]|nr:Mu transposase C-terminal domain-containing protein [Phycisphaeraceae bacterium]
RIDAGQAPTLDEFIEHFRGWLEADYHDRVHTGDSMNMTPNQAWAEKLTVRRDAPEDLLEVITQKKVGPVAVTKLGVCYHKMYYGQLTDELCRLIGQRVYLRINPARIGMVSVWDEHDRFICIAPSNIKVPANASSLDLREAIGAQRRQRRRMLDGHRAEKELEESLPDRLVRAAQARAKEASPSLPGAPPVISPVRTHLDDQIGRVKQEEQRMLRKAVGDGTPAPGSCGSAEPAVRFQYRARNDEADTSSSSGGAPGSSGGFRYVRDNGQEDES